MCFAGMQRSPTALNVAFSIAREKMKKIEGDSVGYIALSSGRYPDAAKALNDYDHIFVMNPYMKEGLIDMFHIPEEKIHCLDIEDRYRKDSPELVSILEEKLRDFI